jgi:hypothetical protein
MSESVRVNFNIESMKLGIRGVSLLATGDDGAPGYGVNSTPYCAYYAMFPAYWTYVGGTMVSIVICYPHFISNQIILSFSVCFGSRIRRH